jgi:serine/threonine-protein kinase
MPQVWSHPPDSANLETILELGEGGMGKAYLARTTGAGGFHRLVVIKRLNLQLVGVPEAVERFLAEARIAARIHHANVIGTQQIGRDTAGPFIVLDYIEGGTLDDLVSMRPLPVPVILRIALDALYGLRAVHEARDVDGRPLAILHRDISLQNILISALDGIARLSDFGVAKSALGNVRTEDGIFVGKLRYFSPEYLRREPIGVPLDIYALGVTLWLAFTRRELWEDADDAQVMQAILDEGIPPLRDYVTVAPQIEELVSRACDRDPRRRFQTAREMADVLEHFDREHGWLASHAEVAALVEATLAPDLVYRRRRVSRVVHGELGVAPTESKVLPAPAVPSASERARGIALLRAAPHAPEHGQANIRHVPTSSSGHTRRSWRTGVMGVLGVAGVVLLAFLVAAMIRDAPAPERAATVGVIDAPARARAQHASSNPSPPVAVPSVAPSEPDVEPGEPAATKPSSHVPAASGAPAPGSERSPRPNVGSSSETAPETSLRKQNPYRRAQSASDGRPAPTPPSSSGADIHR